MSLPRRRSARLASASKPKAVPPPATLTSVAEHEEPPSSPSLPRPLPQEPQSSPISHMKHQPSTPSTSVAKPPASEMHPSKIQRPSIQPSSAVKHGFRDLNPTTRSEQLLVAAQATPTKVRETPTKSSLPSVPTSTFSFSVNQPGMDKGLSFEAQKIMEDLREEAAAIKARLLVDREREKEEEEKAAHDRKITHPKGKGNRYSAAHMAEFRKMDSIENHPSAYRAAPGRFSPVKVLKRKSSKANLDDTSAPAPTIAPATCVSALRRSPSKANMNGESVAAPETPSKIPNAASKSGIPSSKRLRQKMEDDAATTRPVSRDASSIPRPTTASDSSTKSQPNFASKFSTPSKSVIARPADSTIRMVKTPSKSDLVTQQRDNDIFKVSVSRPSITTIVSEQASASPMTAAKRFDQLKSILKKSSYNSLVTSVSSSSVLPAPSSVSKTPASTWTTDKLDVAARGMMTPSHRLGKYNTTTTPKHLTTVTPTSHVSPSFKSAMKKVRMFAPGDKYPSSNSQAEALEQAEAVLEIKYPDLSKFSGLEEGNDTAADDDVDMADAEDKPTSVPGTFSFRSDKTIDFGVSKPDFGAGIGQASIRQVRQSIFGGLPGAFPKAKADEEEPPGLATGEPYSDKENSGPTRPLSRDGKYQAISHGLNNKKRSRASTDEEDAAARKNDERAAKKRCNEDVLSGISVKTPVKSAAPPTARSAPGPTRHFSTGVKPKPKPKTPGPVRTQPAVSARSTGKVPGFMAATSAAKSKELETRKIAQPVRPTDKLKAAASQARTPAKPGVRGTQTPSKGTMTPGRSRIPAAVGYPVKQAGKTGISASRLAQLAVPKKR